MGVRVHGPDLGTAQSLRQQIIEDLTDQDGVLQATPIDDDGIPPTIGVEMLGGTMFFVTIEEA